MGKIIKLDIPYQYVDFKDLEEIIEGFSNDNVSMYIKENSPRFYNSIQDIIEPVLIILSSSLLSTISLNLVSNSIYDSLKKLLFTLKNNKNRRFLLGKKPDENMRVITKVFLKIEQENGTSIHFEVDDIPDDKIDEAFKQLENAIKTITPNENPLLTYEKEKNEWRNK